MTLTLRPISAPLLLIVLVVPAVFLAAQGIFAVAMLDVARGGWAAALAAHLAGADSAVRGLLGSHSRMVWSALALVFAPLMLTAAGAGVLALARRPFRWRLLGAVGAVSLLVGLAMWLPGARRLLGCLDDPCGGTCATASGEAVFLIIPYMGGLFCGLYEAGFVAAFLSFFAFAGPIQVAVTTLLWFAALSLVPLPAGPADMTIAGLRRRKADFRLLLAFSSAILTYTGIMELSLWGWLAEIAGDWPAADALRGLQIGSALYWGLCNTTLLALLYLPLGALLLRQARALAERENPGAALPALETWEREQGLTLMGRGAWPQVIGLLAPFATGAFLFLFQSAVQ